MPHQSLVEPRPPVVRPWRLRNDPHLPYYLFFGGLLLGLLFVAYTLSYGLWIWIAVEYNLSDNYAWIQDGFYGPLHWLSARSEWYGKLTGELFWWGYGPV